MIKTLLGVAALLTLCCSPALAKQRITTLRRMKCSGTMHNTPMHRSQRSCSGRDCAISYAALIAD